MTPTDLCNWNHPVIDHIALYSSRSIISVGMYLFIYILSVQIFCLLLLRDKVYLSFQWLQSMAYQIQKAMALWRIH